MPPIIVQNHNPRWAEDFAAAKSSLEVILSGLPIVTIEHVGSTSIPGLVAKPIVDIDIEINECDFANVSNALTSAGYTWLGESGFPGRHAYWQPGCNKRQGGAPAYGQQRRNTYVVFTGCLSLRNHRDLKRILLEDAALRKEYADTKLELVQKLGIDDVVEYCTGKNAIVSKILTKAGWSKEDLDVVTKSNLYARTSWTS